MCSLQSVLCKYCSGCKYIPCCVPYLLSFLALVSFFIISCTLVKDMSTRVSDKKVTFLLVVVKKILMGLWQLELCSEYRFYNILFLQF